MAISDWGDRWQALRRACAFRKATGRCAEGVSKPPRFEIGPPATQREVAAIETKLGRPIPASFRNVLLGYSQAMCIEWALPEGTSKPQVFREVFAGECRWDLATLASLQETYHGWLTSCFKDRANQYDRIWHNKFPVLEVGNGDMLGIDLTTAGEQPVVFLSHEGGNLHGYRLGRDFEDYVDRLSLLGCVGSEDWQLALFLSGPRSLLETNSANAKQWREWFGLRLTVDDVQEKKGSKPETPVENPEQAPQGGGSLFGFAPGYLRGNDTVKPQQLSAQELEVLQQQDQAERVQRKRQDIERRTAAGPPCPSCGKPLRTAKAKQCFHCGRSWRETRPQ